MRCCIFGAGDYRGELLYLTEGAFVIAADAGYRHLASYGLSPALTVGDFDSLGAPPAAGEVLCHPVMKDDTDMALAAEEGLARGCDEFWLFGGMGGRPDHTLANLSLLLSLTKRGCRAYLAGREGVFTALAGGSLLFESSCRGTLSVFSAGERAEGVTLENLLYPLSQYTLVHDRALGVSNRFIGRAARISLLSGALYVFWEDLGNPFPRYLPFPEDGAGKNPSGKNGE